MLASCKDQGDINGGEDAERQRIQDALFMNRKGEGYEDYERNKNYRRLLRPKREDEQDERSNVPVPVEFISFNKPKPGQHTGHAKQKKQELVACGVPHHGFLVPFLYGKKCSCPSADRVTDPIYAAERINQPAVKDVKQDRDSVKSPRLKAGDSIDPVRHYPSRSAHTIDVIAHHFAPPRGRSVCPSELYVRVIVLDKRLGQRRQISDDREHGDAQQSEKMFSVNQRHVEKVTLIFVFETRSSEPERIDTGDYTDEEYKTFLREIRFINRWIGDRWALRKSLLKRITELDLDEFSVLDVGAGSGEILKEIAMFARQRKSRAFLVGLDLNELSAESVANESKNIKEINSVRGDALRLPFADKSFDFAICSLFTHHFTDDGVVDVLREMHRVADEGVFVIDLHREVRAYRLYQLFCSVFGISKLVRDDGLLSIKKGFQPDELTRLAERAGFANVTARTVVPARVVISGS